ncbi:MAG TPA: hypothetical protein VGQ58_11430 [Candidatus Limnocylindrales bacterium]|jgi:hypothetical protein|nr:hypothetical protein [Candidatus Limnocylindrales bacterium]
MRFLRVTVTLLLATVLAGCGVALEEPSSPPPTATPVPTVAPPPSDCPAEPDPGEIEGWDVGSQTPSVIPVITNIRLTCGTNRVVIGLLSPANVPVAAPDRSLRARFFDLSNDPANPSGEATGLFTWAIEGTTGLYIVSADFDHAGVWGVEIVTQARGGPEETIRLRFDVAESTPTIRVGQKAPASDTPTAADVGGDLALVSTDDDPEPTFYDTSIADALAARRPFVVAFATPKFCTSATCGPTLDRLKPFAKAWPSVDFINVEPYRLEPVDGQLQPVLGPNGELQPVAASEEWGLLTEPAVFVVDAEGTVRGAFEGAFADDELRAALAAVDVPTGQG